jgi:hypothetical protein
MEIAVSGFRILPTYHRRCCYSRWARDLSNHPLPPFGLGSAVINNLLSNWTTVKIFFLFQISTYAGCLFIKFTNALFFCYRT